MTNSIMPVRLSIAVRARNEEAVTRRTLSSLFSQSLFAELHRRREQCEVVFIPDGCTDRTAQIAMKVFTGQKRWHPFGEVFSCRVGQIPEPGQNMSWNVFVHDLSHREAEFLFFLDSGIAFNRSESLLDMYAALLNQPEACVASDGRIMHANLTEVDSLFDRIFITTPDMTRTIQGRLIGRPYCIRAEAARRIWLPKDLDATDEDFIKAIVCTDFLTRTPSPRRVIVLGNGSHVYDACMSIREVVNVQTRQMIARTTLHLLIEHLKSLPLEQRTNIAATLKHKEETDAAWLKWLIDDQLSRTRLFRGSASCWEDGFDSSTIHARLEWFRHTCGDKLTFYWRRWHNRGVLGRLKAFSTTVAGLAVTLVACARALRCLRLGQLPAWAKAGREQRQELDIGESGAAYQKSVVKANRPPAMAAAERSLAVR